MDSRKLVAPAAAPAQPGHALVLARASAVATLSDFSVSERAEDGVRVVAVAGELDVTEAPEVERAITSAAADRDRALVIDLAECEFIDSTGLAAILHGLKPAGRLDGGQGVAILCPDGHVRDLFRITAIDQSIPVVATADEAMAAALGEAS
jgi:anti-sigma B factor antagonist